MKGSTDEPYARFDAFDGRGRSWELVNPLGVVEARRVEEVADALARVEAAVAGGAYAGGYVAYEAAPGLDPKLTTRAPRSDLPLVWFGLFRDRRDAASVSLPPPASEPVREPWVPALSPERYRSRVGRIRDLIASGDTYQVNLSFPLRSSTAIGDDLRLYSALGRAQRAGFSALLRLPQRSILSISPELFFRRTADRLELRPMKGTRPRGRWAEEDRALAAELRASEKDRAENLMIVDLLRNDAGRVAEFGSVRVERLFQIESYPTVHQLTSTIHARTRPDVTLVDLFRALFPSGSVTGAPKRRTMEIIAELEDGPRGVYTGAVGMVAPGEAVFNVAIRTLLLDASGGLELAVGSGVTWGSDAAAEYVECLQKAAFSRHATPAFSLLETLLFEPGRGFRLLPEHLRRMEESAEYFRYPFDRQEAEVALAGIMAGATERRRVRLLLSGEGTVSIESSPLAAQAEPLRAHLASEPVSSSDPMLYHKTTLRAPYERRLGERPGYDEALLVNERGEPTEFVNGNLVARIGGRDWTPPLECGLLPGLMRARLLRGGTLRERVLSLDDLKRAEGIYRINSVRGVQRVELEFRQGEGKAAPPPEGR